MADDNLPPDDPISSDLVREDPSFADIVLEFLDGLSSRLGEMEDALRNSDFERLRVAAHQLKGSGGGYGYPILTERAAELETLAKSQSLDDCIDAVEDLKTIASRVIVGD
jgi:HPt (histidine-containing phosphotransfer) domain-containing protein